MKEYFDVREYILGGSHNPAEWEITARVSKLKFVSDFSKDNRCITSVIDEHDEIHIFIFGKQRSFENILPILKVLDRYGEVQKEDFGRQIFEYGQGDIQ